jgi:nicotinamidase-related amidase
MWSLCFDRQTGDSILHQLVRGDSWRVHVPAPNRIASLALALALPLFAGASDSKSLALSLQKRVETAEGPDPYQVVATRENWDPKQTAIIVCDMWDLHHCKNAVKREREFAPRMNELLEKSRAQGVFIIHAPSSCMAFYEGHPARVRAQSAPKADNLPFDISQWCRKLPSEETVKYPLDDMTDEEDDDPEEHRLWAEELAAKGLNPKKPWTRQIDVLKIHDRDAITDSGVEVWNLLEARGIRHMILMGVHVNKCVTGRPFGLRQMVKNGRQAVLVRDLTDSMYNPKCWPYVDHYRGTELFIEHVEKFICPTITSDQFLGGNPFAFRGNPRGKAAITR